MKNTNNDINSDSNITILQIFCIIGIIVSLSFYIFNGVKYMYQNSSARQFILNGIEYSNSIRSAKIDDFNFNEIDELVPSYIRKEPPLKYNFTGSIKNNSFVMEFSTNESICEHIEQYKKKKTFVGIFGCDSNNIAFYKIKS